MKRTIQRIVESRVAEMILSGKAMPGGRVRITVRKDGEIYTVMQPEKRRYFVQQRETTEAAIHTTFMKDLYAVLGGEDGGVWVTRIYHNPLVPWMWIGSLMMILGGALSLSDRRLRVGAPKRHAIPAATVQPAGAE